MPARYAPLPNPRSQADNPEDEMEAAFEISDDEDDSNPRDAESRPLNPTNTSTIGHDDDDDDQPQTASVATSHPTHARRQSTVPPGTYDFESADYDFPPPGSPPRRDRALPFNDWGNSNGLIPTTPTARPRPRRRANGRGLEWVRRVLPQRVAERLAGTDEQNSRRIVGDGTGNDGVFANVTAKPAAPRQIQEDEDGIYVIPEDAQKDAPPSYASAQADAVPPYWETTVHAPPSLESMQSGDLPIDGLATGTVFSFLWNMLVSISFQFVGFLLTYLLHTTHAAKMGARAGLGLTLVQYGFALRSGKEDNDSLGSGYGGNSEGEGGTGFWSGWNTDSAPAPTPTLPTAAAAESWFAAHPNATMPMDETTAYNSALISDLSTEWLAFLLMTIGWFILLNSLFGFWRIKRWERSILASYREDPSRPPPPGPFASLPGPGAQTPSSTGRGNGHARQSSFAIHFERTLGLRLPTAHMLRTGLGFGSWGNSSPRENDHEYAEPRYVFDEELERELEDGVALHRHDADEENEGRRRDGDDVDEEELPLRIVNEDMMFEIPAGHPDRARLIAEAVANERRLQRDLRAAGLL